MFLQKSSWAAAFTVASVWFGTHVGGGFASGNQVIQYFAQYGWTAAIFPLLAMGLLAYVIYIISNPSDKSAAPLREKRQKGENLEK